mmetsp:Transcript_36551/g.44109  ORF Transcript_36551/g.44109 Transcript_36551/m.44109 type:complete len:953 (+) Transcript_36551:164-3022(+)|eukprot:CAMPEP_0194384422 /NCGR_PEP_ID=MMETSP0174-20130528/73913_1 /TAXON_ID=216777 /ORGANISM="Proboscia alata, Strain PI-D3" /LENGTH=952 /DNA_ID=CAMNT_0039171607 /DNA_START=111 /DNA_END=2969 /DNA_ORIENTATION=-
MNYLPNQLSKNDNILLEGWLMKRGRHSSSSKKNWSERYFVLRGPTLSYYVRRSDEKPKDTIDLYAGCKVGNVESVKKNLSSSHMKMNNMLYCFKISLPENVKGPSDAHILAEGTQQDMITNGLASSTGPDILALPESENNMEAIEVCAVSGPNSSSTIKLPAENEKATISSSNETKYDPLLSDATNSKISVNTSTVMYDDGEPEVIAEVSKSKSREKTKKLIVQSTGVVAAAAGAVTVSILTAGVGLVPGLLLVGMSAAAGGSGAVAGRNYIRSKKTIPTTMVLAAESLVEALKWKKAIESAILAEELPQSTWASLFTMDGHTPSSVLLPANANRDTSVTQQGRRFPDGHNINSGVSANQINHRDTTWIPIDGGWINLLGMGATELRIYEEDSFTGLGTTKNAWNNANRPAGLARKQSLEGHPCQALKASVILNASPLNAFMCLMSHARIDRYENLCFGDIPTNLHYRASFRIIETIDDHTDVIQLSLRPLFLFPSWTSPRDFCLYRCWKIEDDGSYVVCYDSYKHRECPPTDIAVRGDMHGVFVVAPLKEVNFQKPQCLLTHIVQVDPAGWIPTWKLPPYNQSYAGAFSVASLLQIIDVRDALDYDRFVSVQSKQKQTFTPRGSLSRRHTMISGKGSAEFANEYVKLDRSDSRVSWTLPDESNNDDYDFSYSENEVTTDQSQSPPISSIDLNNSIANIPLPLDQSMWAEPDANSFRVRGPKYLDDKVKINAGKSKLRLFAVDIVTVESPIRDKAMCANPTERVQRAIERERDNVGGNHMPPYVVAINLVLPSVPVYHLVMYYAVDDMSTIDGTDGSSFSRLANKFFFGESDEFRDNTFKLIPQIVEGNFMVRRAVGSTPAIMGNKLKQYYFRGERYFELLLDITSSSVATSVVRLSLGYAATLVVDMAFLLEGKDENVLPESVMGCCRLKNVVFTKKLRFTVPWNEDEDQE